MTPWTFIALATIIVLGSIVVCALIAEACNDA